MAAISTRYGKPDGLSQGDADASHPGFTVTCNTCKSTRVYAASDLGFSSTSGAWGGVDLVCFDCGASTALLET